MSDLLSERKSVYIESTIPSYATARPSANALNLLRQAQTLDFWDNYRDQFDLFVGTPVIDECKRGDKDAVVRRMKFIEDITIIKSTVETDELAITYQKLLAIPESAKADCEHLAICVLEHIDFCLSWNMAHLGNTTWHKIDLYNSKNGLWVPKLETPESIQQYINEEIFNYAK